MRRDCCTACRKHVLRGGGGISQLYGLTLEWWKLFSWLKLCNCFETSSYLQFLILLYFNQKCYTLKKVIGDYFFGSLLLQNNEKLIYNVLQCTTEFNKSRSVYRIVKQNRLELEHQQLIKFRGALVNANLKLWFERVEHNYWKLL